MPSNTAVEELEILVTDPHQLHKLLNDAEALLQRTPQQLSGILVTRHEPGRYSLAISDAVPYGETWEQLIS